MHRIPLSLVTPTVLWERNLPEWVLFERTLNKHNVEETDAFLTILDSEADFYKNQSYGMAEDMFSTAQKHLNTSNANSFAEGMFLINIIILRTPKDSPILASALKIRGNYSFHGCSLELASNDFEMFLQVVPAGNCRNDDICEVYGNLVICMYMMRQYSKVKKYFRLYKKYRAKLSPENLQRVIFVKTENHIRKFISEIDDVENVAIPKFSEKVFFGQPHKGFTANQDIPGASASCYYYNKSIYTHDEIPKAGIVFMENPVLQSLNVPFVQCEVCYRQTRQQVYTCLECRYKTYCSLCCLERDKLFHKDECVGYKQLTLLVLDASTIFRAFIQISIILHEHILNPKIFRKLKAAGEVWDKILELLKAATNISGMNYLDLITMKPFYSRLSQTQYTTLNTTAFRLTIFIDKHTNLIETYFKKLQISNKQKLILVGSILMRIHCNMLHNTLDFEISTKNTSASEESYVSIKQIGQMIKSISSSTREVYVEDIDKFYNIDAQKDIRQRSKDIIESQLKLNKISLSILPGLQHVEPCNIIHRILSTYKDNIAEVYFNPELMPGILYGQASSQPTSPAAAEILCARIADMTYLERCLFVKKFAKLFHSHYTEYFLRLLDQDRDVQQVLSLHCLTLSKFQHSCVPNIEVIVLENGVVIGKALRNIKKGEQLYVYYKAHHMLNVRLEREMFLMRLNVQCKCKYCKMDNTINEPTNLRLAIYCESCNGVEITPAEGVCSKCNIQYNSLLHKYRTLISILENELNTQLEPENYKNVSDRDIYILNFIIYSHSRQYFPPQNELQIKLALKMARYLATKNFSHQAFILLKEIRKIILLHYDEHFIWFTFYAEILLIIKIILWYNLEEKMYSIPSTELLDLCTLGLHITTGQKDYIDFYEAFDKECSYILDDIGVLLKWKDTILCTDFLPLADSLNKSKYKYKSKSLNN